MLVGGFNEACNNISSSSMKVGYESMSAISFWKMAKGNLPHLSYIFRKPDPLGTDFNTVACSITWDLLFVESQRGKEVAKNSKYQKDLGATASCTMRMMETTKGISQKYRKGATKDCFIFDSWLYSKKSEESAMEVGAKLLGMVKTNNKGF